MKTASIILLLAIISLFVNDSLRSQTKPLPIIVTCRESTFKGSYVLQIQNSSNEKLNLWLHAKGKTSPFLLPSGKMVEFGWAQGYKFDANNLFLIGGSGYDTIKQVMPNVELSPWRIGFSKDGGLAISLSQSFLQKELPKYLKLPIKESASTAVEIELNQMPQIVLKEESDRIYSKAILQASLLSGKLHLPIVAEVSFIPSYIPDNGQIIASQIKIENIDMSVLPKEWLDDATQIVNKILPILFAKYVVYQLEKNWQLKIAKAMGLRTKVIDGRLEIIFL